MKRIAQTTYVVAAAWSGRPLTSPDFITREEAERALESIARYCDLRRDEMFVREATRKDRRAFKPAGFVRMIPPN
jgi:hypothetical protein